MFQTKAENEIVNLKKKVHKPLAETKHLSKQKAANI